MLGRGVRPFPTCGPARGNVPVVPLPVQSSVTIAAAHAAIPAALDGERANTGRRPGDQRLITTVEGPLMRKVNRIPSDIPVPSHEVKPVRFIVRPSALTVPWAA